MMVVNLVIKRSLSMASVYRTIRSGVDRAHNIAMKPNKKPQAVNIKSQTEEDCRAKDILREQIKEFPISYPDFLQNPVVNRRVPLYEELIYSDMFERRMVIDIPEFYVGSIMGITTSDPNQGTRKNRFVGICVSRNRVGLHHQFTLRNVVDGMGVEVMYELYNPTILRIDVLKLERRLDDDLSYLIDALPEYSTFPFDLAPIAHPAGTPVPINPLKVKLRPPPWMIRYALYDFKGIDNTWEMTSPYYKQKLVQKTKVDHFQKYDVIKHYRNECQELEHDVKVQTQMRKFENTVQVQRKGYQGKRILRSAELETMHQSKKD